MSIVAVRDTPVSLAAQRRVWSLWDLMNQIHVKRLCIRASSFIELKENYERLADVHLVDTSILRDTFVRQLGFALKECEAFGLDDALLTLRRIERDVLVLDLPHAALAREADRAAMSYIDNLNKLTYVFVPTDLREYVDRDDLFGPQVTIAFGYASVDIKEAGNCLAVGSHTAAVFHLMRATELVLRAFCFHLGFHEVVDKYDKTGEGQHEYRPIEYSTWEKILGQLQSRINAKLDAIPDRKAKHEAQEFFVVIAQEIWALKEAWRNHVMHARRQYIREDVLAVMAHVKRLMVTASSRLSEV